MAFFFRIVEFEDGSWSCRQGRRELARFGDLDAAIETGRDIACEHAPSEVFVHDLNGRVQSIATFE